MFVQVRGTFLKSEPLASTPLWPRTSVRGVRFPSASASANCVTSDQNRDDHRRGSEGADLLAGGGRENESSAVMYREDPSTNGRVFERRLQG
jgi:hypothetical protein